MIARTRPALVLGALLAVATLVTIFAVYQATPPVWTVDVGGPLSGPLLHGFYADEADAGGQSRARWTRNHAEMTFAGIGTGGPAMFAVRVAARPPGSAPTTIVTATIGGRVVDTFTLTTLPAVLITRPLVGAGGSVTLALDVPAVRPPDDARDLGLKIEWVRLALEGPAPTPPADVLVLSVLCVLGVYLLLGGLTGRPLLAAVGASLTGGLLAIGLGPGRPLLVPWLAAGAVLLAGAGIIRVGWRMRRGRALPASLRWSEEAAGWGVPGGRVARLLLALALLGYAAYALSLLPGVDWIGHADYADNAVVARNIAAGRGPVIDYVPQFYSYYPGITHPAGTWPLLQPLLIAPFFAFLGAQTWVAKLPNLVLLLALVVAVYHFGSRWWDRRAGLLGALLTLLHPYFFFAVLYPLNDLAFALLAFLTIAWAWAARDAAAATARLRVATNAAEDEDLPLATRNAIRRAPAPRLGTPAQRFAAFAGLSAGLLIWSKGVSGGVVLAGVVAALLLGRRAARWAGRRPPGRGRPWLWAAGAFGLVLAPLVVYNLLTFHTAFYSTESIDLWILRFWTGGIGLPWENIYANYLNGRPLPNRALLLHSYEDLYRAVGWGFTQMARDLANGTDWPALPVTVLGLAAWLLSPRRLRGLALTWAGSLALYGLVVLLAWHYESRYFQALVPWLALGAGAAVVWVVDRARPGLPAILRLGVRAAGALLALALLVPGLLGIARDTANEVRPDNFAAAGRWAAANLPADAVVMIRNPWEFNWYAERKAVMIPEGPLADIQAIVRRYGVTHLWLGGPGDSTSRRPPIREALTPLYRHGTIPGFATTLLYDQNGYYIYRLDR